MIDYKKKIVLRKNGKKHLTLEINEPQYELLEEFLAIDVPMFGDIILINIDLVLNGEAEERTFAGNICELVIKKDQSHIECVIEEADIGSPCDVDTYELKQTILSWLNDLKTFKNSDESSSV